MLPDLMHPTQIPKPFHTKGWVYEEKKDPAAPYVGGRTLKWLKVKQPAYRVEARGFYKP